VPLAAKCGQALHLNRSSILPVSSLGQPLSGLTPTCPIISFRMRWTVPAAAVLSSYSMDALLAGSERSLDGYPR
jgi:hypothetical protein